MRINKKYTEEELSIIQMVPSYKTFIDRMKIISDSYSLISLYKDYSDHVDLIIDVGYYKIIIHAYRLCRSKGEFGCFEDITNDTFVRFLSFIRRHTSIYNINTKVDRYILLEARKYFPKVKTESIDKYKDKLASTEDILSNYITGVDAKLTEDSLSNIKANSNSSYDRNIDIYIKYTIDKLNYTQIGEIYNISRARACQIVKTVSRKLHSKLEADHIF